MTSEERANNPYYFEAIQCSKCQSQEDLYCHRYNGTFLCVHCVNELVEEEKKNQGPEDYYYEKDYNQIAQERNA